MDIRDDLHTQLEHHVATIRLIARQDTPPLLIWQEIQSYLTEAALHIENHVLPKVAPKAPYLDMRTGHVGRGDNGLVVELTPSGVVDYAGPMEGETPAPPAFSKARS